VRNEAIHCETLLNVSRLITELKTIALFTNVSFENIISDLYEAGKYKDFDFLRIFCENENELPVPEKWKSAVEISECKLYQWEKDVLIRLCNSLCVCSRNDIEEYCEKALDDIKSFLKTAKEKKENTTKSKAVIALSTGIMIALLFI
jgi:hypothetical protein